MLKSYLREDREISHSSESIPSDFLHRRPIVDKYVRKFFLIELVHGRVTGMKVNPLPTHNCS